MEFCVYNEHWNYNHYYQFNEFNRKGFTLSTIFQHIT